MLSFEVGNSQVNNSILNINSEGLKDTTEISLITHSLINYEEKKMVKKKIDSYGATKIEFNISKPQFIFLNIGEKRFELYFIPKDTLTLNIDFRNSKSEIKFSGKNSYYNNYLSKSFEIFDELAFSHTGKMIHQMDVNEFIDRMDTINLAQNKFHKKFVDSTKINPEYDFLVESYTKLRVLSLKMNRYLALYHPVFGDGKTVPIGLINLEKQMVFDDKILNSNMTTYQTLLTFYMDIVNSKTWDINNKDSLNIPDRLMTLSYKNFSSSQYSFKFREYFLAKTLYNALESGKTSLFEKYYNSFLKEFPNSKFPDAIERKLLKWLPLKKSNIAPTITGTTLDNKIFNLTDLNDKIVLIDIWATWCGPCVKAFPDLKKIQRKYESNKNIVFLMVSIDENKEKWIEFLNKNYDLKGTHISQTEEQKNQMTKECVLNGVPRYILLNHGKIEDANAPSPSSPDLEKAIDKLIH